MKSAPIETRHLEAILRNNERFVHWLSPLDREGLTALLDVADYARQLQDGEAALIGYDGTGPYRHKNVDWLARRYDCFYYIDRIVVGEAVQARGVGRALYADLEAHARAEGFSRLACEVNTVPDNPRSHAFHARLGFVPIGEESYPSGVAVRYYAKEL